MRKIILTMQISLDGIVSNVDKWMDMSDDIVEDSLKFYKTLDEIIIGGRTYPSLAEYWHNAEKSSDSELERRFAKKINKIGKIVLSRSETDLVWQNSRKLPSNDDASLIRELENLKEQEGKNISVESGVGAWQAFIRNNLFDEIWMFVHPVVVGSGEKLFTVNDSMSLQLIDNKVYKNGVIGLYYRKVQEK